MLPNLYYRRVRDFKMAPDKREEMFGHMHTLSSAMVCEDIEAMFDFAAADDAARKDNAGCVGYCMSGPFAFAAAAAFPDRIMASASFHGVRLFSDAKDSPHLDARRIQGEMYFGCAEKDEWAPTAMIDDLGKYLEGTGIDYRIEWYPGTQHGFVFPLRDEKYHKASAERHWERLLAMYGRCL
jgi:carboxymethylenebutenolidase